MAPFRREYICWRRSHSPSSIPRFRSSLKILPLRRGPLPLPKSFDRSSWSLTANSLLFTVWLSFLTWLLKRQAPRQRSVASLSNCPLRGVNRSDLSVIGCMLRSHCVARTNLWRLDFGPCMLPSKLRLLVPWLLACTVELSCDLKRKSLSSSLCR